MSINIINLTPHAITFLAGEESITIPPTAPAARVSTISPQYGTLAADGLVLPLVVTEFGEVVGLPESQKDTIYLVSRLVLDAVKFSRGDVYTPHDLIRDNEGNIIGCRALSR